MNKKLVQGILLGMAASLAALLIWGTGALERWEHVTWAWRVRTFARPGPATGRIKIILLDQASLEWGEKVNGLSWPWPREVYVPIIDFCRRHGARAVIFDVLYTEPSLYGVSDDEALGKAIERAPSFIGSLCLHRETGFSTRWPLDFPDRLVFRIENRQEGAADAFGPSGITSASFPVGEIAQNAWVLANVMDEPDLDGIFRRASLFHVFDQRVIPSPGLAAFGVECVAHPKDAGPAIFSGVVEKDQLRICEKRVPLDRDQKLVLRFRGSSGAFQSFSAAAVIQSELLAAAGGKESIEDAGSFKDAYVFFGFSAPGLLDLRPTPISRISPGVEIHATVLDNLLSGDFLRETPPLAVGLFALIFSLLTCIPLIIFGKRAWHSMIALFVFIPLPAAAGFAAYPLGFWQPIVVLELAVLFALTGAVVLNYKTEGMLKSFYKKAFQQYLSPAVIDRLLEDPSRLRLGGERKLLTIFFSDLEGFSTLAEKLDPEALTGLLNDYLSDMTDIILQHGGTLDKYEGDAIMAFWGAPIDQPDHAQRACRAAILCQRKLAQRRDEFHQRTGALLRARIGIHTGEVVVGNMGSKTRFDYTVLGDAANLASRLEGANKTFGTFTMVSEETWRRTEGAFAGRQLGLIRVVGRAEPVRVFELAGLKPDPTGEEAQTPYLGSYAAYEKGLALCREQKWHDATGIFEGFPDDPVSRLYADLCAKLLANPGQTWDGIWNLVSK